MDLPLDVFLYMSVFPQLVTGPIVSTADFLPLLKAEPRLNSSIVSLGIVLILIGLLKKMVIANYLAPGLVDEVFVDPSIYAGPDVALPVYGYAIRIYSDFSGYSDIAIGVAALLGYRFKWIFNQPYQTACLQEFRRRWHNSLADWLRDYFYEPLGLARPLAPTTCNLILTIVLGGIWHGAAWTFGILSLIHGTALTAERLVLALKTAPGPAPALVASGYDSATLAATGAVMRASADMVGAETR